MLATPERLGNMIGKRKKPMKHEYVSKVRQAAFTKWYSPYSVMCLKHTNDWLI